MFSWSNKVFFVFRHSYCDHRFWSFVTLSMCVISVLRTSPYCSTHDQAKCFWMFSCILCNAVRINIIFLLFLHLTFICICLRLTLVIYTLLRNRLHLAWRKDTMNVTGKMANLRKIPGDSLLFCLPKCSWGENQIFWNVHDHIRAVARCVRFHGDVT